MAKKKELNSRNLDEWDPNLKEPWLLEFEKQPVNDERWACLVTSAIPDQIEDNECINIYKQSVTLGPRQMIKILSMSDVVNLLKEHSSPRVSVKGDKKPKGDKKLKEDKVANTQKNEEKLSSPRLTQILNLVIKFAIFNDFDCKLPPNLMAVLLKYMILKMKNDSIRQKKINAVKERKIRERNLKAQFIRDLKPFDAKAPKIPSEKYKNDAPINGPDLYILLTDFFDVFCYPELLRINVPFVAFLKIVYVSDGMQSTKFSQSLQEKEGPDIKNKEIAIEDFWKNLKENCTTLEKTWLFKDIAFMKYTASRHSGRKESHKKAIYNEMSWMQYAAYFIYCQHQKYLKSINIQTVPFSLKPLDLSKCEVYNKLCDTLLTGQPLTPLFVLYAMIEQLVVGIPETESVKTESDNKTTNFFPKRSTLFTEECNISKDSMLNLGPSCQCRNYENICKTSFNNNPSSEKSERNNHTGDKMPEETNDFSSFSITKSKSEDYNKLDYLEESSNFTALIDQVLSERKAEKDFRKDKKYRTPRLCFYSDLITLQTYHCDPRIINPEELFQRFMKTADLMNIWAKYPELPPGEKAYYNFHYNNLVKISQEKEETLRIKIYFAFIMKISGVTKFYLFAGNEENVSTDAPVVWKANKKNSLELKLHFTDKTPHDCFPNFFVDTFMLDLSNQVQRKTVFQIHKLKILEFNDPWKTRNESKMYLSGNRSSVMYNPHNFMNLESLPQTDSFERSKDFLLPVLDCLDITALSNFDYVNQFQEFPKMVEHFSFYEKLEPSLMIQRLLECRDNYNTIYCTYFPPTDALAILMHNDSDHRGIYYKMHSGSLPTPIALRDFYDYVYPEIGQWVSDKIEENRKFSSALLEEKKAEEEKKDKMFLAALKLYYRKLSEKDKKSFLEQEIDFTSEPEVTENELCELPCKTEPISQSNKTFVVTNMGNLRIENSQKVHEFHSKDGTEVRITFNGWMYDAAELIILTITRCSLSFRYNFYVRSEKTNYIFSLRTESDIHFTFFKESETPAEEHTPFNVKISWPTGLMIEVKSIFSGPDSNRYIKQFYIETYRKGWDIEEEKLRCYLKNGEIIIIKETGNVKILTASGTIHNIFGGEVPLHETMTMTGEVWEQPIVQRKCVKRRKISTLKIYLGADCKTGETYYKREDGTSCMLWPSGTLVTNYPDGTKITSIPDFYEDGVSVEWNEDEKLYFLELQSKLGESTSRHESNTCLQSEEFVSVFCTYLMEHPKYSTVYSEPKSSLIEIRMLENLRLKTSSRGCYEVQKNNKYLVVNNDIVKFYTQCDECGKVSTSDINFDTNILCRCVDFFENEFVVHKNGETLFYEKFKHSENSPEGGNIPQKEKFSSCSKMHAVNIALKQKCFFLERNLSGIEFIHEDEVARYCNDLQDDSYFDLNTDDPNAISHTFSNSLRKIGYENWVMNYEKDDSLPINLKKKDLKDIEVKENRNKLFKYPFPQSRDVAKCVNNTQPRQKVNMPKMKLVRTLKCLPYPGPLQVIQDVRKYAEQYQKRAHDKCNTSYRDRIHEFNQSDYLNLRLQKIAVTLNQTLTLYPHVCTQVPSTEKDVHYFGHLINTMGEIKNHFSDDLLPECKHIPNRLPRISNFPTIREE